MQLEELGQNVNFRFDIHKICHNPNKNYIYNRKLKTAEILNKIKPSNLNTNLVHSQTYQIQHTKPTRP